MRPLGDRYVLGREGQRHQKASGRGPSHQAGPSLPSLCAGAARAVGVNDAMAASEELGLIEVVGPPGFLSAELTMVEGLATVLTKTKTSSEGATEHSYLPRIRTCWDIGSLKGRTCMLQGRRARGLGDPTATESAMSSPALCRRDMGKWRAFRNASRGPQPHEYTHVCKLCWPNQDASLCLLCLRSR